MVYLEQYNKVEKISEDTFKDLKAIRQMIIDYGTKNLSDDLQPTIEQLKDNIVTYKGIMAVSVKFLRIALEKLVKHQAPTVNTI